MQIIPFKESGAWKAQISLSSVIYILYFKWNALNKYWVMSVYDRSENPILLGVKIVTNYDLTQQFVILGMPPGHIICQNFLGKWDDIQRFDMGETTEIIYYENAELELLA